MEESKRGFSLRFLAQLLWAWLTFPLPQFAALIRLWQIKMPPFNPAYLIYLQAEQATIVPYYWKLIGGALLLSVAGPIVVWLFPRMLVGKAIPCLAVALVLGIALGYGLVSIVAPHDSRARTYPVDPTYFVFATSMAAVISAYLRIKDFHGQAFEEHTFHDFLVEGAITWLFVLQALAAVWLRYQEEGMEKIQLQCVIPALVWTWLCPIFLWRARPRRVLISILWAAVIAFLVSKIVGIFLTAVALNGFPAAAGSWMIGYFGEGEGADPYRVFGPSVIWGLIMGIRRWQYLRAEELGRVGHPLKRV